MRAPCAYLATEDSTTICFAIAAVGGIRFKLARQWFRVDTIQHVASFYLKFLRDLGKSVEASDFATKFVLDLRSIAPEKGT